MKRFNSKYITYILLVTIGLLAGWFLFHDSHSPATDKMEVSETGEKTIWTCSMHPHIRKDAPGKCPICGMDLIPLNQAGSDSGSSDPMALHLSPEAAQLANVMTSTVSRQKPVKELRLYGKIQSDERSLQSQTAHIPGRIERLMVNFTGDLVKRGQTLAEIYSPELITAQQELLEAAKMKSTQPAIYEASRERLLQWKISEQQVNAIEESGKIRSTFPIIATSSGIVTARRVNSGDHVSQGTVLYDIADLSNVWAMFDAYESDLPFLNQGDKINFTVQALPGTVFNGKIDFIDPVIDPVTRVAKVRLEIKNSNGKLKPEMFITGILQADLTQYNNNMVIPRSAVLWTGKRSIVYVKVSQTEPVFKMREIEIGPALGNSYIVIEGLKEGEEIVTSGAFNVDAASQLEGKPSMMNPEGGSVVTGHDHPGSVNNTKIHNNDALQNDDEPQGKEPGNENEHPAVTAPKEPSKMKNVNEHEGHKMNTSKIEHQMFKVSGNCEMCKERIEKAALSVKGVQSAVWDQESKMIHLNFDAGVTNTDKIQKAIADAGHDTGKYKASESTYNSLPDCCKYRG